ncbi:MAG: hypothetical protein ACRDFX_10455, partial [Chloroflexota bacterium]
IRGVTRVASLFHGLSDTLNGFLFGSILQRRAIDTVKTGETGERSLRFFVQLLPLTPDPSS